MLLFPIHLIEDLSQYFGLSYDKYLAVLCKISRTGEKEASQAIVLNSFEPLVVLYWTCLRQEYQRRHRPKTMQASFDKSKKWQNGPRLCEF